MIKAFYAVIVSAIAAGCFVAFPNLLEQVRAMPPAPVVMADNVTSAVDAGPCGLTAWPYIEAACLRNGGPIAASRDVRFVSSDRRTNAPGR